MGNIQFIWDENKNLLNQKKHKITFDEAISVFYDKFARVIYDPDHSKNEDRYIILGISINLNILVVVHCYHLEDEVRIISVRKATKMEKQEYLKLRVQI